MKYLTILLVAILIVVSCSSGEESYDGPTKQFRGEYNGTLTCGSDSYSCVCKIYSPNPPTMFGSIEEFRKDEDLSLSFTVLAILESRFEPSCCGDIPILYGRLSDEKITIDIEMSEHIGIVSGGNCKFVGRK